MNCTEFFHLIPAGQMACLCGEIDASDNHQAFEDVSSILCAAKDGD
jgi:hypothetical protein